MNPWECTVYARAGVLFTFLSLVVLSTAYTSHFHDIVNDWRQGKNYYNILGINEDAKDADITRAFRRLSLI